MDNVEKIVKLFDIARAEGMIHSKDGEHSDSSIGDAQDVLSILSSTDLKEWELTGKEFNVWLWDNGSKEEYQYKNKSELNRIAQLSKLSPLITSLKEQIKEFELVFDTRQKADERAIKSWKEAHPDKPLTIPDHADMCTWLMEQINEAKKQERERIALFIQNQPTDGWDKWYFYNKELANKILQEK